MTSRRRRRPSVPPFTNHNEIPLVLDVHDMARWKRRSVTTIYRLVRAGTFRPAPRETKPRYLWHKEDVLRCVALAWPALSTLLAFV